MDLPSDPLGTKYVTSKLKEAPRVCRLIKGQFGHFGSSGQMSGVWRACKGHDTEDKEDFLFQKGLSQSEAD